MAVTELRRNSIHKLLLSLLDSLKNPGVLAKLRDIYSQRLTIVGVSLVLVHQDLDGVLHKEELDGDALLVDIQSGAFLNHSLLSPFLDTHGPVLITMLTVEALCTLGEAICQMIRYIIAIN